jgi:hypothetical protein
MKCFLKFLAFTIMSLMSLSVEAAVPITSIYTNLSGKQCKTVKEDKETGSFVRKCPGVGGFHLLVAADDARMSVTVMTPDNAEHPLDYWYVITRTFSSLGKTAEWRVVKRGGKITPIALIIRVDTYEQEDVNSPKKHSYLAVAKITPEAICITATIGPAANANAQARQAADRAADRACLPS